MQTPAIENQGKESTTSTQFPQFQSPQKDSKNNNKARIDLRKTEYPILFNISNNSLSWKVWSSKQESKDDRDVIWNDNYISQGQVRQLHFYQRINHFPGSQQLGKKNLLAQNLNRMKNLFSSNFFPKTWLLPKDSQSFKIVLEELSQNQYYIAKPESMSQGKGIFLFNSITQLPPNWEQANLVIQKYINKPYLIDGLKFDFRIYVLLRSINPLRIYIYKEGLTRFATVKYEQPSNLNYNNIMMHLTNYAINKKSPQFIFNTSNKDDNVGHKRSYTSVIEYLKQRNVNTQQLQLSIDSLITKTILSGLTPLNQIYKKTRENKEITSVCFEILGFDIMIDENLKPYLIQVNHTPSFTTDTPLDYNIKKNLLEDTLNIIRVDVPGKREYMNEGRVLAIDKLISDIQLRELQIEEDSYQERNQGGWRRIFPTDDSNSSELLKIHDEILGIKPLRLYRINYQSLNKNRIAEMKKKQKHSNKYFPYILEPGEGSGNIRDNYFQKEDYYISDRQFMKYRVDHSMPVQSLFKTVYKKEKEKEQKYIVERSAGGRKYSYKNIWMLNKNERIPFHLDKLLKGEDNKEHEPLRLKKLEIDFLAPQKQRKISRNNITKAASKSFHIPSSSAPAPDSSLSSPVNSRVVYPTKNILFNFQKNKKQKQQTPIQQQFQSANPQNPSTIQTLNQTKYLTVSPTKYQQTVKEDDFVEPMLSPSKMSTLYYETNKFKRSSRVRENAFARPAREVFVNNFNRKFSCEQKRLIIGYD